MNRYFIFGTRYAIVIFYIVSFLLISFLLRFGLYIDSWEQIEFSVSSFLKIFFLGFVFDLGTAIFFILPYSLYLLFFPKKMNGSWLDKILTYFILFLTFFITFFSFLGEIPFWEEFNTRYNFIAVDYLIYTYEVIENINQSYPLPFLIIGLLVLCSIFFFLLKKFNFFRTVFNSKNSFKMRLPYFSFLIILTIVYSLFIKSKQAEYSNNTYENELSKNGVYSFFAAYRSNQLDYDLFYPTEDNERSFAIIREELRQENQTFIDENSESLLRKTVSDSLEIDPNIILICLESFNTDFMQTFGNKDGITPNIDRLAQESVLFGNMYATGTRTVRGMEAITLSVPPTPGNSIVRRLDNEHLFSIASILKSKDYVLNFFYGGDGYFDNMNSFFGGQGFNIIDRNRGNPLADHLETTRTNIEDEEVTFENAWGICDEDIYRKVLQISDENFRKNKTTFSFVMTTSNHRPYSFPENKIDLPQGNRKSAVKYTDFALGDFIEKAKSKPWFRNTIFVVIADHCASSAGKWEIAIDKHHIPAFIYNLPNQDPLRTDQLVSQIDIMPTVFGYLNWDYNTALYGKDIRKMKKEEERALIGNYRTLGLLKDSVFTEVNDRKKINQYIWNPETLEMSEMNTVNETLENLTISYYQTASERFKNGLMKERKPD